MKIFIKKIKPEKAASRLSGAHWRALGHLIFSLQKSRQKARPILWFLVKCCQSLQPALNLPAVGLKADRAGIASCSFATFQPGTSKWSIKLKSEKPALGSSNIGFGRRAGVEKLAALSEGRCPMTKTLPQRQYFWLDKARKLIFQWKLAAAKRSSWFLTSFLPPKSWRSVPIARNILAAFVAVIAVAAILLPVHPAGADGIAIAPLKYQSDINGTVKKGVVDISNNSGEIQNFTTTVEAFRQINNNGALQFYQDPLITAGITPDYQNFQLKPQEEMHLYFKIDGQKLPKKRIFAAILAEATPLKASYNITPVLQVGTLLLLKNGNGDAPKQGSISNWHVGLWQLGNGVTGSFSFKNTEQGNSASGYFPNFTASVGGAKQQFSGNLVFPGIQREQSFTIPGSRIGIYNLKLTSDAGAGASQWVVVLTGYWRWLLPLIVVAAIILIILAVRLLKRRIK